MTTAQEWRNAREIGIEYTFPSGNTAMIRPLDVGFFIRNKKIPSILVSYVNEMISTGIRPKLTSIENFEQTEEFIKFLDDLVMEGFVSPIVKGVGEALGSDEISVDDVSYFDKSHLWQLFGLPAKNLISFRDRQKQPVETVAAAADNGDSSQQTTHDKVVVFPNARNA